MFLGLSLGSGGSWAAPALADQTLASGLRVVVETRAGMRTAVVATSHRVGDESLAALTARLVGGGDGKIGEARARLDREGAIFTTVTKGGLATFTTVIDDRHLPLALWLAAIRMAVLDVSADSFSRARDALGAEIDARRRDDLAWHARTALAGIALESPLPGTALADLRLSDARAFHASHFGPGRAALVIISPVATDEVLALVDKTVGAVRRPTAPIESATPPAQSSRRATSLKSDGVHRAGVAYGWRIPARGHADLPALAVAAEALGGGSASVLHHDLVVKKGAAFAARADVASGAGAGLLEAVVIGPRHAQPIDLATAIQTEAGQLGSDPRAIAGAQKRLLRRLRQRLATPVPRAQALAEHALYDGEAKAAFTALERIAAVTAEDVRRVARAHLTVDGASLVECFPAPIYLNEKDRAARDALEKQAREQEKQREKRRAKKGKKKRAPAPKRPEKKRSTKKKGTGKKRKGKKK